MRRSRTQREGFLHKDLIVYAVQYELESSPSSWLIVWLDERGNSVKPHVRPAEPGQAIATVRPGDTIAFHGRPQKVVGVTIYRALSVDGGYEIVG